MEISQIRYIYTMISISSNTILIGSPHESNPTNAAKR